MDHAEASRIAHGELRLWNPLSEGALDEAIALLRRVAARWDVNGVG